MGYKVQKANIFGQIGESLGKSLAETVPKEIERHRLSSGLRDFSKNAENMTPMQQMANLLSIPGMSNQGIESMGKLARNQQQSQALTQQQQKQPIQNPFQPQEKAAASPMQDVSPSITKPQNLEEIQRGYIPPTQDEIVAKAGQLFNANPALYNNEPDKAIQAAEDAAIRQEKRAQAYQQQHQNLTNIQDNVVSRLKDHSSKLGVQVPANVYSKIEDKAIQATKPISEGGEGLTEQQAMKKYGNELDEVSRDYKDISTIGDWGVLGRSAKATLGMMDSVRKRFEARDDTENMADMMISENGVSPMFAYAVAEPVYRNPELTKVMRSLPELESIDTGFESVVPPEISKAETMKIVDKISSQMNNRDSPLAIAYILDKMGYDAQEWMDHLNKNVDELRLTPQQIRQISKPRKSLTPTMNDAWLSSFSGLE